MAAARLEYDDAKRAAIYRQLQKVIHDDYPVCFLFKSRARSCFIPTGSRTCSCSRRSPASTSRSGGCRRIGSGIATRVFSKRAELFSGILRAAPEGFSACRLLRSRESGGARNSQRSFDCAPAAFRSGSIGRAALSRSLHSTATAAADGSSRQRRCLARPRREPFNCIVRFANQGRRLAGENA